MPINWVYVLPFTVPTIKTQLIVMSYQGAYSLSCALRGINYSISVFARILYRKTEN